MNLKAVTLNAGKAVDFRNPGRSLAWYQGIKAQGYDGVLIDLMSTGWQSDFAVALQAGLGVALFQGYYQPAWADPPAAAQRAQYAVQQAETVQYPARGPLYLDLENVDNADEAAMIAWVNTWSKTVSAPGFTPGLYVGANQPISGTNLYQALIYTSHYWKSASTVPDVAHRGYQIVQTAEGQTLDGQAVDDDTFAPDALGDSALWVVDTESLSSPSSPPVSTSTGILETLVNQVNALQNSHKTLETTVTALQEKMATAGKALGS